MKHLGRASSPAATDRYSAILRAAERLFGDKGYRGVSIDQIARTAGVSKGLVLYHFTSKKALVEHLLKDALTTLLARWDAIAQSHQPVRDKLGAAVDVCFDMYDSRPYLLRIAFFQALFEDDMKDMLGRMVEETVSRMEGLVKDGIAAGEFRPIDSKIAASLLLVMSTLPPLQAAVQPQAAVPSRRIGDEITRLLCDGICL
jgi:TetR/AcrR family transcriptional regulator